MIIALVVLQLAIVVVVVGGSRHQDLSSRRLESVRSLYAAEGGMNMAIRELMVDADEDGDGTVGGISDDGDGSNDPTFSGARVAVTKATAGSDTTLTSRGRSGEATRALEAHLQQ